MTLTNYMGFSECVGVIASDTRQVANFLGQQFKMADKDDKIVVLPCNIITVSSGYQYLSDFLLDKVNKAQPKNLNEVYKILEKVGPELKAQLSSIRSNDFMSVFFMGLNKRGILDTIAYNFSNEKGEIITEKVPYGLHKAHATFPDVPNIDELLNEVFSRLGGLQLSNPNDFKVVTQDIINYLIKLQKEFFETDSEAVSEILCYHAIYKDRETNKYVHVSGRVNVLESKIKF